jgi:lactobin A/cerein 7B family class IIb bacteriocin
MSTFRELDAGELAHVEGGIVPLILAAGFVAFTYYCAWQQSYAYGN